MQMGRRYICRPSSSVPSETVLSTIGNIYEEKRSSLKGENALQTAPAEVATLRTLRLAGAGE